MPFIVNVMKTINTSRIAVKSLSYGFRGDFLSAIQAKSSIPVYQLPNFFSHPSCQTGFNVLYYKSNYKLKGMRKCL
jgi:hypothetical protein